LTNDEGGVAVREHVDVVQVDWGKGTQTKVARVHADSKGVWVDTTKDALTEIVLRAYTDRETGQVLTPEDNPNRFVARLHTVMNGSFLVATELHMDSDCLFREHDTLDLLPTKAV